VHARALLRSNRCTKVGIIPIAEAVASITAEFHVDLHHFTDKTWSYNCTGWVNMKNHF
jgi:hypothetical protein